MLMILEDSSIAIPFDTVLSKNPTPFQHPDSLTPPMQQDFNSWFNGVRSSLYVGSSLNATAPLKVNCA